MKFAVPFKRDFKYFEDDNLQLDIIFKPQIEKLQTFIESYQKYRINLIIGDQYFHASLKIIRDLREKFPNAELIMALNKTVTKEELQLLKEYNFLFYFTKIVDNFDEFHYFLKLGVTDILIGYDLGFYVKFLSKIATEKGIKLRAVVDFCQTRLNSIKGFFIRPEDISVYAKYIDTFEFRHPSKSINTIYEIYTRDKKWYGQLKEIILNYSGEEDSRFILPAFANIRCGCKRRCLYDIDNNCQICDRLIDLGKSFKKENIIVEVENEPESN